MPLYCYYCTKCHKKIEVSQRITEDAFRTHSEACLDSKCEGTVKRQLFAPLVKFKGPGFYETDYKRKPTVSDKTTKKEPETKHVKAEVKD